MTSKALLLLAAAACLTACAPSQFETEPVEVETPAGTVTCQLYTRGMVDWDRAIARPESMSVAAADAICRQRGVELQRGG